MNWRRARELRAAVRLAGGLLVLSGLLAVAAVVPRLGDLSLSWPPLLAITGIATASRFLRAGGRVTRDALARDVLVMAAALLIGGVVESLHAIGLARPALFHLTLAGSLALIGLFLLTANVDREHASEAKALTGVRVAGYVFLLAALTRGFVVGADQSHGFAASLAMLLLVIAGVALIRAASTSPSTAWR